MSLDIKEMKKRIDEYFKTHTREEIEKDLEVCGEMPCPLCGLKKAKDCDCKIPGLED